MKILELNDLKKNYQVNMRRIFDLENEISNIQENELRTELENYKNFERLNNEKITP
jgi:hypothetical protein